MKKGLIVAVLCCLSIHARATVNITITAADLQTSSGALMPTNGLVMLVASTTNSTFTGPLSTAFATNDDIVLKKWDLSASGTPGVLTDVTGPLTLSGDWNAGDPLQLYWYPTLTLAATSPGSGTSYGQYTDAVGIDGSDPWITPSDGSTIGLIFLTADEAGSNPQTAGRASFTTESDIPEPSACMLIGLGLAGWLASRRRRIK